MTEDQYKQEWLDGQHQTDYNLFRFSSEPYRIAHGYDWLKKYAPERNIREPKNLADRCAAYKLHDTSEYKAQWSDKILTKTLLTDLGLGNISIPEYACSYGDISVSDFETIPEGQRAMVKCNHGSGWNIIVNPKDENNCKYVVSKVQEWLGLNYAYISGYEWQYEHIKPGWIIQPILSVDPPIDYQFYCEDGKIVAVDLQQKISKVIIKHLGFTDTNGSSLGWYLGDTPIFKSLPKIYVDAIQQMLPAVLAIAEHKKFIRVDMFYINNTVYFCEATFSPCSGVLDYSEV